jgi:hypothetical protein
MVNLIQYINQYLYIGPLYLYKPYPYIQKVRTLDPNLIAFQNILQLLQKDKNFDTYAHKIQKMKYIGNVKNQIHGKIIQYDPNALNAVYKIDPYYFLGNLFHPNNITDGLYYRNQFQYLDHRILNAVLQKIDNPTSINVFPN